MAAELGKLERPEAEPYRKVRKLYLVPLVLYGEKSPPELQEKCKRYWKEVRDQLANLEGKIGRARHIYHESIVVGGDEGVDVMEKFDRDAWEIAREHVAGGAVFELTEDRRIAEEAMDWERCLMVGFITEAVASKVSESFSEASRRRYEYIAQRVDETLKETEAGLIFISEGHRVQFPKDIEVFIIFPPALDEIHRWLREQVEKSQQQGAEGAGQPSQSDQPA